MGQLLGAISKHSEWVKDQKRLEYRQLLDQLYDSIDVVQKNCFFQLGADGQKELDNAVRKLARVFADRIFIARQLRESGALDDWAQLKELMYGDAAKNLVSYIDELRSRSNQMQRKIMKLADNDVVRFKFMGLPIEED